MVRDKYVVLSSHNIEVKVSMTDEYLVQMYIWQVNTRNISILFNKFNLSIHVKFRICWRWS